MTGRDGGARPDDVESIFAEIISDWQGEGTAPRWPDHPLDPDAGSDPPQAPGSGTVETPGSAPAETPGPGTSRARAGDADEHFVPLEPPPLPRPRRRTVGGLGMLLLGMLLVAAPNLIGLPGQVGLLLGLLSMTGGIGWLGLGLREPPPRDAGPDDGAVL